MPVQHTLDNGLRVILAPTNSQAVTLNITYRVGSANEGLCQTGDTHILEHMMFGGSKHYNGDKGMWSLEECGATMNATTYLDRTNYYEVMQPSKLTKALALEADRMQSPLLLASKLKSEMRVVRNEYERQCNNPFSRMQSKMMNLAFLEHPYGHSTIGFLADIEHVTADNIKAYHHKYYTPCNATVIVAGNVPTDALNLVKTHFERIPAGEISSNYVIEPVQHGMRRFVEQGKAGIVGIGFKAPRGLHEDAVGLELLAYDINHNGIFQPLVDKGIVYNITASWQRMKDPALFSLWASAPDPDKAEQEIWAIIDKQPHFELPIDAVKQNWSNKILSSQSLSAELNEAIAMGDYRDVYARHSVVQTCKHEHMWKYLQRTQATVGIMKQVQDPIPMPIGIYDMPNIAIDDQIDTNTLEPVLQDNICFVQADHVSLRIEYNSTHTPAINALTADMITKCSDVQMGANGVQRTSEATRDGFALSYAGPTQSIQLIVDELKNNKLNHKLHQTVQLHANSLASAQNNVDIMVVNVLRHKLLGDPMPNTEMKELKQVQTLSKGVLPCKITLAGTQDTLNIVKQLCVKGFKTHTPTLTPISGNTHIVADKTSCAVAWGCPVKENAAVVLAASILGGGFAGRLMKTVRDQMGLTYGIYAGVKDSLFVIKSSFNPTLLQRGCKETEKIIKEWQEGVTTEELQTHKNMIMGKRLVVKDDLLKYITFLHHNTISDQDILDTSLQDVNNAIKDLQFYRVTTGSPQENDL